MENPNKSSGIPSLSLSNAAAGSFGKTSLSSGTPSPSVSVISGPVDSASQIPSPSSSDGLSPTFSGSVPHSPSSASDQESPSSS